MELKIKLILKLTFLCLFINSLQAEVIKFNPASTAVEFLAIGNPSAIKIKGEKAKVHGEISLIKNILNSQLKIDLNEFETGVEMRDEHMKENYLETNKPENRYANLTVIDLSIPADFWKNSKELITDFKGKLTLHGVTKEITGKIFFQPFTKGKELQTNSQFTIKLSDFNIEIPSFVGITVAEDVKIDVKLPLEIAEK